MPRVPFAAESDRKVSPFDAQQKYAWVLEALLVATESIPETLNPAIFTLPRTASNRLDKLYRHEIIHLLTKIGAENNAIFQIDKTGQSLPVRVGTIRDTPVYRWNPPDKTPIRLILSPKFKNWRAAHIHRTRQEFSNLLPINQERVRKTVLAIDEKFQLNSSPVVKIDWVPSSSTRDWDSRTLSLDFLQSKGAVNRYTPHYLSFGGGFIEVEIDVAHFLEFKEKLGHLPESDPSEIAQQSPLSDKEQAAPKPFAHLKWEDISIQFIDGNNVRIAARGRKITAHYKEMGFEDGRTHNPDSQWELLRLLATSDGELSWGNPKANSTVKKKKQLLSRTLREYFAIEGDPFYPFKDGQAYRIKITLLPEPS